MKYPSSAVRVLVVAAIVSMLLALAGCGSGVRPISPGTLTASPTSIAFADTSVGSAATNQTITLTGSGAALTITAVGVTGANASSFSVSSTCIGNIDPGKTCTVTAGFTPASAGALSASLVVTSQSTGSPLTIALSGTGLPLVPVAVFSATSLNFGNLVLGANATSQTVNLRNSGTGALKLSTATLSPTSSGYSLGGTCATGASVAVGASCTLVVTFAPTALGTFPGTLTVATNAAGSPQVISLAAAVYNGISFTVRVLAGKQPVAGAVVQLYAAGSGGLGSAATPLLATAVTTDASGTAVIPAQYSCNSPATQQVYLLANGGAVAGGAQNPSLVFAGALGTCNLIAPGMQAVVDEATTVAAAFALAPFYRSPTSIGASSTNTSGIANAFLTATELVEPTTGTAPGKSLPANVTLDVSRIDSLANLANTCAATPAGCGAFFSAVTPASGTAPTTILDALVALAQNPGTNVAALYALSRASTAYNPIQPLVPTDWSLYLTIAGGGMNSPSALGLDSVGNVWVANYFNVASKFNPLGAAIYPNGITGYGLNHSYGLAVDLSDNAWITNEEPLIALGRIGSVTVFTPNGVALSGANGYTDGGLNYPVAVAIDPNGTHWVVNYGNSRLVLLDAKGKALSGSEGYASVSFQFPDAVAVDGNHFGWVGNQAGPTVTKVAPDGSSFTDFNCCNGASGLAIDQTNNVWVANFFGDSVSLISSSGAIVSNGYTAGSSLLRPQGIAVDGAGSVWVANYRLPNLVKLAGASSPTPGAVLSPAAGLGADAGLLEAFALAVDASGSLWVTNQGSDTVTKFIGMAAPVKTPLSGVVKTP